MTPLPPLEGACALFLDFDGTLADIAAHADAVQVVAGLPALLERLGAARGGALAVVSGRPVAEIDHHLHPARLPAAGVHGVERRTADGRWHRLPPPALDAAARWLAAWCAEHPGTRLEAKPGALALHYRGADAHAAAAAAAMEHAQTLVHGTSMVLMHGKKVIELKPAAADKGRAVEAFLAEPPFAGRRPWMFGDDVTDESAFAAVMARGGVAVKIGDGPTVAPHRLPDPAALHAWLRAQVASGVAA